MQLKLMMDEYGQHLPQQQQQQLDDDSSPSSFVDIESYSPYSPAAKMPPPPMSGSPHEAVLNNINHNGGASSSSSLQWPEGRSVRPIARTITNDTNDCHSSLNHQPMNCPRLSDTTTTTSSGNDVSISTSTSGGNDASSSRNRSSHIHDKVHNIPDKDRFLYILFDILSSNSPYCPDNNLNQADTTQRMVTSHHNHFPNGGILLFAGNNNNNNNEESIAWLPHGRGFSIVNKPLFESETLKRILPNVKYASFVRRLRRYKFIRISSGAEMGAYYHPYFRRDQPQLLPLINTIDEIPIERYAVDVNDVVTYGGGGGGGGNTPISTSNGSTYIDHPASNLEDDDLSPATATFSPIPEAIQLTTTPSSSTKGGSSSGSKTGKVVSLAAEDLYADLSLFEDMLLPFIEEDDVIFIDDDDNGKDLISVCGGAVADAASSSLKSARERKITEEALELSLPDGDIFVVQQQMQQQQKAQEQQLRPQQQQQMQEQTVMQQQQVRAMQSHPAIVTQTTPDKDESNLDCNIEGNSDNVVAEDMKSFPQMLREISKAKRLESITQKKQSQKASSFSTTSSSTATTVINIPTASMGGGPNTKNRFQYRRSGSAPDCVQTHHTMGENMRTHQFHRRMGSTDAIMVHATGKKSNEYQYLRKGSSDSRTSYTMEDRKGKYRYRRNKSCDAISSTMTKSNRFQQHHHRNTDVLTTSVSFEEELQLQQPEEVQPYFVSMDWNGGGYPDEAQQQQHHPHDEKPCRHCHRSRKNGGDPYAELWRQVDEGGGGFQYQPPENTAMPVNNVPDDSLLDLDMDYSDCYKPLVGNHHRNQPQQQHQLFRLPQSPPASPRSHQNCHNDYQQIVDTFILGDDNNEQEIPVLPTMLYNHQQQYYGECGVRVSEELSDDLSCGNGCDDFNPLPLQPKDQFPSFRRRSTL